MYNKSNKHANWNDSEILFYKRTELIVRQMTKILPKLILYYQFSLELYNYGLDFENEKFTLTSQK